MSRCLRCADSAIPGMIVTEWSGPDQVARAVTCPDCDGTAQVECATGQSGERKPYELRHAHPAGRLA